jgi:hypothetical protein
MAASILNRSPDGYQLRETEAINIRNIGEIQSEIAQAFS